ncbi:MAG TPA: hypothetical protein VLA69_03880, partial [Gaiellaceae bacterium]|nr:hypothetical protein [Gaiellaceae bacterium]
MSTSRRPDVTSSRRRFAVGPDEGNRAFAKLALLGHLWWHDEGPLGHVEDVIGFKAKRLWISFANFTLHVAAEPGVRVLDGGSRGSSRTPVRTVTPIDTVDEATSTHGTRVNRTPRRAILTTGVAIPANRWIASVICSVSSSSAKRRFPSAALVTCTSEERRRSKAWWKTSPAA